MESATKNQVFFCFFLCLLLVSASSLSASKSTHTFPKKALPTKHGHLPTPQIHFIHHFHSPYSTSVTLYAINFTISIDDIGTGDASFVEKLFFLSFHVYIILFFNFLIFIFIFTLISLYLFNYKNLTTKLYLLTNNNSFQISLQKMGCYIQP